MARPGSKKCLQGTTEQKQLAQPYKFEAGRKRASPMRRPEKCSSCKWHVNKKTRLYKLVVRRKSVWSGLVCPLVSGGKSVQASCLEKQPEIKGILMESRGLPFRCPKVQLLVAQCDCTMGQQRWGGAAADPPHGICLIVARRGLSPAPK